MMIAGPTERHERPKMNPASHNLPQSGIAEVSALEATSMGLPLTVSLHGFSGHMITGRLIGTQVQMSTPDHVSAVDLTVELDLAPPHFTATCTLPVNADYPLQIADPSET